MNPNIDISGVTLKTERLILRPWRNSDLDDFYAYASVDGVGQMAGWNPHGSKEDTRTILDMLIENKKCLHVKESCGRIISCQGKTQMKEDIY